MTDYPDYYKSTNAAYRELERYDGGFPRIDIFRLIFSDTNIKLITYSQMAQRFGFTHNEFTYNIAQSEQGYSVRNKTTGKSQIIFNNLKFVNHRREFFNVTLDEVKKVILENYDKTVEWNDYAEAEQYRISLKMKEQHIV